jgi:C4-dicarboxylate transporter DctM subunit
VDATTVGLLGIVALLVLIFMGMNIGMALMAVGFFGFAIMTNFKAAISVLSTVPSTQAGSYSMIVVPLFILMGSFAYRARLSSGLFDFTKKKLEDYMAKKSVETTTVAHFGNVGEDNKNRKE